MRITYSSVISGMPPLRPPRMVLPRKFCQAKSSACLPTMKEPSHCVSWANTLGASRAQTLLKLVLPANLPTFVNALKVNVGLSWVGVIMGEFLVSREGLGYLIVYGSQVFKMDLVMATVLLLLLCAAAMYQGVLFLEKALKKHLGVSA